MKLRKEFITYTSGDKHITVSTDTKLFSGIIRSNVTGAFIIEALKKETTREQIITEMLEQFDAPEDIISEDVDKILKNLRNIKALDE